MLHKRNALRRGAISLFAAGGVALMAASSAMATSVPVSARLTGTLVTRPAPAGAVHVARFRPRNAAQYRNELSAANARYANWSAAHSSLAASVFGPLTISSLTKPGMNASVDGGGITPPDTTGAIGPSTYLEFVNSQIAVYSRTLATPPMATVSEDTFTASTSTCDGQIKWDQAAQRWLYYSLDCGALSTSNGFSFGFSKTSSPTPLPSTSSAGNWCRFHVATGTSLEDYGKLGNNNGFMIIGTNEFNAGTGSYLDSPIFAWPKPANGTKVTTCPTSESGFKFVPATTAGFTPEPANTFGSSANGFIVEIQDSTHLHQFTLSSAATPVLTDNGAITVPSYAQPAAIPQPGSSDTLDPSDTRLTQANAAIDPALGTFGLWTQHTVAGSGGGPSVVRWYEIKGGVTQSAPVQTGTISDGTLFAFNGAIAPTALGNAAAINYDVGNATTMVQVRAQDRLAGAAAGTMGNETTLATSTGINADFSCPSQGSGRSSCRWGDYSGASTDPVCAANVWGTNEWNGATNAGVATWATQNFRLGLDECPVASFTATPSSPAHTEAFNGSASSDSDGSISTWTWRFGDGTTGTGATPSHTYAAAGAYKVTCTVKDSAGLSSSVTQTVTVS